MVSEEPMTFQCIFCSHRFVRSEDRKRALVSRLLQYALVHEVLGISIGEIVIKRTLEGKPYLVSHTANYSFSVHLLQVYKFVVFCIFIYIIS